MSKQQQLSAFDRTVLELCAQAANGNEAVSYVADWQSCSRSDAMQYITAAKLAEKQLNKAQQAQSEAMQTGHA